jgi:hypothetical protein
VKLNSIVALAFIKNTSSLFLLTDKEYYQYVKKGQSEYRIRMKKDMEDEEYVVDVYAW